MSTTKNTEDLEFYEDALCKDIHRAVYNRAPSEYPGATAEYALMCMARWGTPSSLKAASERLRAAGDSEPLTCGAHDLAGSLLFKHLIHFSRNKMRFGPGFRKPEDFYRFFLRPIDGPEPPTGSYLAALSVMQTEYFTRDPRFRLALFTIVESTRMQQVLAWRCAQVPAEVPGEVPEVPAALTAPMAPAAPTVTAVATRDAQWPSVGLAAILAAILAVFFAAISKAPGCIFNDH